MTVGDAYSSAMTVNEWKLFAYHTCTRVQKTAVGNVDLYGMQAALRLGEWDEETRAFSLSAMPRTDEQKRFNSAPVYGLAATFVTNMRNDDGCLGEFGFSNA
jgi:hypothetical protein